MIDPDWSELAVVTPNLRRRPAKLGPSTRYDSGPEPNSVSEIGHGPVLGRLLSRQHAVIPSLVVIRLTIGPS